jgi:hypothetical protein
MSTAHRSTQGRTGERCSRELSQLGYVHVPEVQGSAHVTSWLARQRARQVRWDLTSRRVLTTEFIHGVKVRQCRTSLRAKRSRTVAGYR